METPRKVRYTFDIILLLVAAAAALFGAWGMFTASGRRQFDEMDGMYPFFSLVLAVVIFIVLIIINLIRWWRN